MYKRRNIKYPPFCKGRYYEEALYWFIDSKIIPIKWCFLSSLLLAGSIASLVAMVLACKLTLPLAIGKPVVIDVYDVYESQTSQTKLASGSNDWREVQNKLAEFILKHYVTMRETIGDYSLSGAQKFIEGYSSRSVYRDYKTWIDSSATKNLLKNFDKGCIVHPKIISTKIDSFSETVNSRATMEISLSKECTDSMPTILQQKKIIISYSMASPQMVSRGKTSFHFIVSEYSTIML